MESLEDFSVDALMVALAGDVEWEKLVAIAE